MSLSPEHRSLPALPQVVPLVKIRETPQAIWYRARQSRLGRDVLLKMRPVGSGPRAGSAGGSGTLEGTLLAQAREEMVLLSRLHLDGVVAAFDVNSAGEWLYQVVELPPGSPLSQIYQERGKSPWDLEEALGIAERLARTVEEVHRAGIILRRLHPEDIFLAPDGVVKVASLEWASGPGKSPGVPPDPHWSAPEVSGAGAVTPAADVYALGLLLAWLLTGKEPPSSGLRHAREKALEALRARGVREEACRLVAALLDPLPEARLPSAGAAEAIQKLREERWRPALPRSVLLVASVLVLALGGGLLAWKGLRPGARPASPVLEAEEKGSSGASRAGARTEAAGEPSPAPKSGPAAGPRTSSRPPSMEPSRLAAEEGVAEKSRAAKAAAENALAEKALLEKAAAEKAAAEKALAEEALATRTLAERLLKKESEARERQEAAARVQAAAAEARRLIDRLAFEEAAKSLKAAAPPPELAGPMVSLLRELELARAAFRALEAGIERAVAGKTVLRGRITGGEGEAGEPQELVLEARDGLNLTAHRRGTTAQMRLSIFDLDAALLESLAAQGTEAAHLREGLLVLVLGAVRPEPAARFLEEPSIPAEPREEYGRRLSEARERRFQELAADLSRRQREIAGRRGAGAEAWSQLRDSAGRLIARSSSEPFYPRLRPEVEEVFLAAAREALRFQAPENLFRSRVLHDRRDGPVRLVYDFHDAAQARDWTPLGKESRVAFLGESVRLSGAMRLLAGSPFAGRMRAMVAVTARGYPAPPHLGLVLASREEEGKPPARAEESPRSPSLALVLGYSGPKPLEIGSEPPQLVSAPASAAFLCQGVLPQAGEAIWAAAHPRLSGPLVLQAEFGPGHLSWTLNGRPVFASWPESALKALARLAPEGKATAGSLTIFTGEEPVTIDTVEVGGLLDERWVESRIDLLAREELGRALARR